MNGIYWPLWIAIALAVGSAAVIMAILFLNPTVFRECDDPYCDICKGGQQGD